MFLTNTDIPQMVADEIFRYLSRRDMVNVAMCSTECYRSVHGVMWSNMNLQWSRLSDIHQVHMKCRHIGRTKSLVLYNGFISDMGDTSGVGGDVVPGFRYLLEQCDVKKLCKLHFKYYLCPGGLGMVADILTGLESLCVDNVSLQQCDWLPIARFSCLHTLSLYNCNIDNKSLRHITAHLTTSLRVLDLVDCAQLKCDEVLTSAGALTVLKEFVLEGGMATDDAVVLPLSSTFKNVGGLQKLQLLHSGLQETMLLSLSDHFHNLMMLNLKSEHFTDAVLQQVARLEHLRHLLLKGDLITDEGLFYVSTSKTIFKLKISDCGKVTDEGVKHLSGMVALEELSIQGTRVTEISDKGLSYLSSSKTLTQISLAKLGMISDVGLSYLSNLVTCLDSLFFVKCNKITHVGVQSLLTKFQYLTALHFSACVRIDDVAMTTISEFRELRELYVNDNEVITDEAFKSISTLPRLCLLDVSMCPKITDAGLSHIAKLPSLIALNLFGCEISDAGLLHLVRVKTLQQLEISFVFDVTDRGVEYLRELPSLKWLGLHNNFNIENDNLFLNWPTPLTVVRKLSMSAIPALMVYYSFDGDSFL